MSREVLMREGVGSLGDYLGEQPSEGHWGGFNWHLMPESRQ